MFRRFVIKLFYEEEYSYEIRKKKQKNEQQRFFPC